MSDSTTSSSAVTYNFPDFIRHKVIQGTCGWTDAGLKACNRFYPVSARSSSEKLEHYSRGGGMGCVEVDSSTYAIPHEKHVKGWVDSTPSGFIFHFKAFAALCLQSLDISKYPHPIRDLFPIQNGSFNILELPSNCQTNLWQLFNNSLLPAFNANKLGCVVFQFHLDFVSSSSTCVEFLSYISSNLDQRYKIAVEFRNRSWLSPESLQNTLEILRSLRPHGVALVASDDLEHELYSAALYSNMTLTSNKLPLVLSSACCPHFMYIRIHRRQGTSRLLADSELIEWANLIEQNLPSETELCRGTNSTSIFSGPIFVLWGTDHEDQGIINSRNLHKMLSDEFQLDWRLYTKSLAGGVMKSFQNMASRKNVMDFERSGSTFCSPHDDTDTDNNIKCDILSKPKDIITLPVSSHCFAESNLGNKRKVSSDEAVKKVARVDHSSGGGLLKYFNSSQKK